MATVVAVLETATANAATFPVTPSGHVTDDVLAVCLTQDVGTVLISLGNDTVTVSSSSGALFTYAGGDYFDDGIQVELSNFGGTTPGGFSQGTRYYVRDLNTTANTFRLETSPGSGAIAYTSSGSSVVVHRMTGGASANNNCVGWAIIGAQSLTNAAPGSCRQVWAYKVATSASEATPTFTGTTDDWLGVCHTVRYADTTTPINAWQRSDWVSVGSKASNSIAASSAGGTTVITTAADSLLLYSWSSDSGGAQQIRAKTGDPSGNNYLYGLSWRATSILCAFTGARQASSAANPPDVTMYSNTTVEGGNGWVIEFKNATNGDLQQDANSGVDEWNWHGNFGNVHGAFGTSAAPSTLDDAMASPPANVTISSVNGSAVAGTVAQENNTASKSLVGTWTAITSTENTGASPGLWVGSVRTVTSKDMSGKLYSIHTSGTSISGGRWGDKGSVVVFADNVGEWVAYQLYTKAYGSLDPERISIIALGQSAAYGTSSGTIDWTQIVKVGYFHHRIATDATGTILYIRNEFLLDKSVLTGGGANFPASPVDVSKGIGAFGTLRIGDLQGSAQVLGKFDMQIGDGTKKTYFQSANVEFPTPYSVASATSQQEWNVNANQSGITVKASANDTIDLSASSFKTSVAQTFTIDAASSSSATYLTNGCALIGFTVTDNLGIAWSGTTFKYGGTVTITGGGDLTNCTIASTASTNAALAITENGSVLTGTSIDGTGAAYALELGASVTAITLTDCTLTAGSLTPFDKVHVLKTTGTVTITISGTTSLVAGDVTSAGATVSIAGPTINQKVTVSGITTGARVQIYDTTSSTELFNGTATAGDTVVTGSTVVWTDPAAASADRAIRIRVSYVSGVTAKNFIETSGLTCRQTSGTAEITYPVSPTDDTVYNANGENGSTIYGGGEITFVDASPDRVDMNMTAATLSLQKQYAAWVYYAFTATGIATDIDYINAIDTANYEFTNIRWKNTATAPATLSITGGYAWDSSTGLAITLVDTSGGTIFLMPDHVVAYATGSGVTAQDVADIAAASATSTTTAVLAAAQTTPIHADIRKVLGGAIDGTGSDADPWGPV